MGKLHLNLNCFFNFTTHCTHTLLEAKSLTTCVKKTQIATTRANSSIFYQLRPPLTFLLSFYLLRALGNPPLTPVQDIILMQTS